MNTVEVLEKLLAKRQENVLRYDADSHAHNELVNECAALHEVIGAVKVIESMDYRHSLSRSSLGWFLTDLKDGTLLHGATITDLAEKLK